jgi:hypothetical protein
VNQTSFSSAAVVDYHVVSCRGALLYTSPDRELARAWAYRNRARHPGLQVEEVTVTTSKRRIYKPAPPREVALATAA